MELTKQKPSQLAPLTLAYIGDGVYELFVRTRIIEKNENMPAQKLHKKAIQYVKAQAQSQSMGALMPILTEEEEAVFRRGRNAKSHTVPKNADLMDYKRATGFEALIGYLYLSGQNERLAELMNTAYENALNNCLS